MSLYHTFQSHNGRIYCALITLRVLLAFTGLGYVHPDEYFQNGEVTAGKISVHTVFSTHTKCTNVQEQFLAGTI